jgi:hypothetical protein
MNGFFVFFWKEMKVNVSWIANDSQVERKQLNILLCEMYMEWKVMWYTCGSMWGYDSCAVVRRYYRTLTAGRFRNLNTFVYHGHYTRYCNCRKVLWFQLWIKYVRN